jgi:DNA-binding response OmpR family regulator
VIGVLLVDDDALTLELHRTYIERLDGFEVIAECTGARAAVTAILDRPDRIDLVLLDVTMPDGTGLDVLRHIRARGADVDVIAITGVRDADVVRQMVSLGVSQYLVKPFPFAMFRDRLEQYREYRQRTLEAAGTPPSPRSTPCSAPSGPRPRRRCPRGSPATRSSASPAICVRTARSRPTRRPSAWGCRVSPPAATSSTSSQQGAPNGPRDTARRGGPSRSIGGSRVAGPRLIRTDA